MWTIEPARELLQFQHYTGLLLAVSLTPPSHVLSFAKASSTLHANNERLSTGFAFLSGSAARPKTLECTYLSGIWHMSGMWDLSGTWS